MPRNFFKIIVMLACCFMFVAVSAAQDSKPISMGIVTGGLKGTYYQFGLNLRQLLKRYGIKLNVVNTEGSVDNIFAVYKRPNTQLGIVQADVLAFVAKIQTDPELQRIATKIKMVYPLYNEEIHLLGKNDIADFDGLEGKKVAIGQEGSGTHLTVKLLFEVSGIKPAEILTIAADTALEKLKRGEIDALFYVAGYPVKLFSEQVSAEDALNLIPIQNKSILDFYQSAEIPANTYTWQTSPVQTAAVKAVLISFDFRNTNCLKVGKVADAIKNNFEWLQKNGHPKWRNVDLEYPLKGWLPYDYDCVKQPRTKPDTTKAYDFNPVLNAIKEMM